MLKITLDTNQIGDMKLTQIQNTIKDLSIEISTTSVTDREIRGSGIKPLGSSILETGVWDESDWGKAVWGGNVSERFVLGESELDNAKLGSTKQNMLEVILQIIGDGSFPKIGSRGHLSKGQRNQLRDAMILEAHVSEKRDILVSDDKKAYIGKDGSKRRKLEKKFGTKILTSEEFIKLIKKGNIK